MKSIKVKWTGLRPLLMSNAEMIDHTNPATRRIKEISAKGSKKITDSDREEMAFAEWKAAMYWRDGSGFYLPSDNIEKTIREGASKSRLGKLAEAASFVSEPEVPVITKDPYPKHQEKLYKQPEYQLRKPVRVPPKTGARIMKVRPMVPTGWSIEFTLEYDDSVINQNDLVKAMNDAGALVGIGNWRPKFGRFIVEIL